MQITSIVILLWEEEESRMPHPIVLEGNTANGDIADAFGLEDVVWVVHLQSVKKTY